MKLASNSRGQYLGDSEMEPLFSFLNERKAVINIHPHRPTPMAENIFTAGPVPHLFDLLMIITTPDHVLYGCDYPYTPIPEIIGTKDALREKIQNDPRYAPYDEMFFGGTFKKLFNIED